MAANGVFAGAGDAARGVLEPLNPTDDTHVASTNKVAVATRMRLGVSQLE